MKNKVLRKLLVIAIMIIPVLSYSDCKKQAKCGCDGDILFSLTKAQAHVYYNETGTTITCTLLTEPYSTYNFCNPGEMFPKLENSKSGDILLVSGDAYWECNYLYQTSNGGSYQTYYKVYMLNVTDVTTDMYGKK
jgi:hypothetical protein